MLSRCMLIPVTQRVPYLNQNHPSNLPVLLKVRLFYFNSSYGTKRFLVPVDSGH